MPLNLGNTMFARWYNQQEADRAAAREQQQLEGSLAGASQERDLARREADRKDLELKAKLASEQATQLGQPAPSFKDPNLAFAAQSGAQGATLSSLAAQRAQALKEKEARAKQVGAIDLAGVEGTITAENQAARLAAEDERARQQRLSNERIAAMYGGARNARVELERERMER